MGKRTGKSKGRPPIKFYNERFEDYISPEPNTGCWLWDGGGDEDKDGYIRLNLPGNIRQRAHRFAYEHYCQPVPSLMCVCHSCDVPSCVNPDHLFLGSNAENTADKMRKGREARGEMVNTARLSPEQVLAIRASQENGGILARQHDVTNYAIWAIRHRKTWKHL